MPFFRIKIKTLLLSLFFLTLLASFSLLIVIIYAEHSEHLTTLWSLAILISLLLLAIVFAIHTISHSIVHLSREIDEISKLNLENKQKKTFHIAET
ncbi:MAG: hypothetical protein FJZ64_03115, partial [Chlamydiae bacterium]|nr:hypothetical protein [Chlamydiota bacterium]